MPKPLPHEPEVFVIRLWVERATGASGSKRGYVEHIPSGHRRYFSDLGDAMEFVAALGGMALGTDPPTLSGESGA